MRSRHMAATASKGLTFACTSSLSKPKVFLILVENV